MALWPATSSHLSIALLYPCDEANPKKVQLRLQLI